MNSNYVVESIGRLNRLSARDSACAGCQAAPGELCTHDLFVKRDDGAWSGLLCLSCVAVLPEPLPAWLMVEPLVACLHLNRRPGRRGQGYCRDCKHWGLFNRPRTALLLPKSMLRTSPPRQRALSVESVNNRQVLRSVHVLDELALERGFHNIEVAESADRELKPVVCEVTGLGRLIIKNCQTYLLHV